MGGNAFQQTAALDNFPRMKPEVYTHYRDELMTRLRRVYSLVTCPPEAPDKLDYGDIDFFVCHPSQDAVGCDFGKNHFQRATSEKLMQALGAVQKCSNGPYVRHFAVPLVLTGPGLSARYNVPEDLGDDDAYIQVDINDCLTPDRLEWMVFKNSYGALWQILGMMNTVFGMTADGEALNLRLEELETAGFRNKCRLPLTSKPDEVLRFMGLDAVQFHAGFENRTDLFRWVASCNLFHASLFIPAEFFDPGGEVLGNTKGFGDEAFTARSGKHKTQQAMVQEFILWVIENRSTLKNTSFTRQAVCDTALIAFNKRADSEALLQEHRKIIREDALKRKIGMAITQLVRAEDLEEAEKEEKAKRTNRALKRYLHFDEKGMPTFRDDDPNVKLGKWTDCPLGEERLLDWVVEHYTDIEARRLAGRQRAFAELAEKHRKKA